MKKLLLIFFILLNSCFIEHYKLTKYIGCNRQQLIAGLGRPLFMAPNGKNGEIIVYAWDIGYKPNGYDPRNEGNPERFYYETADTWHYRMFYENAKGYIYSWKIIIDKVPPNRIDMSEYIMP